MAKKPKPSTAPILAVPATEFFMPHKLGKSSRVRVSFDWLFVYSALPTLIHYRHHQFLLFQLLQLPLFYQVQVPTSLSVRKWIPA